MSRSKRAGHDLEAPLLAEIRLALGSRRDIKLFRVNTGQYRAMWDPKVIVRSAPDGTPDLIGCWSRSFSIHAAERYPDHPNWKWADGEKRLTDDLTVGQFFAIETKARYGKQSAEQIKWQAAFESVGALYILARTVEDCLKDQAMQDKISSGQKYAEVFGKDAS